MEIEEKPIVVTYEFKLPDHRYELEKFQIADKMYSALIDIDNQCRSCLKHRELTDEMYSLLDSLRDLVIESGVRNLE